MQITGLTLEQYKAFPRREELEIRPLTVLIGKNSAGKSSIARLPLLLARAVSGRADAPLDLSVDEVDFGSSFTDLVYNRRRHGALTLGLTGKLLDQRTFRLVAKVQHFSERMLQVVTHCQISVGEQTLTLTWTGREPEEGQEPYDVVLQTGQGQPSPVSSFAIAFAGLLPTRPFLTALAKHFDLAQTFGADALRELDGLLYAIGYLGPFRVSPKRSYQIPGGNPRHVGRSGLHAPALLGADVVRRKSDLLGSVSGWYEENLGGWRLDVDRQGDQFALVLIKPSDPSVRVNLVDAGTGLSQVLPLVVQRQLDITNPGGSTLEIVEQPELHLHPAAHAPLADLYIDAIASSERRFLIETHSENFLLRLRRRIAERTLSSNQVALYWVDDPQGNGSTIQRIDITPSGDISTWPRGVFAEDIEEIKGIRSAQAKHSEPPR